jgi:ferrochelatase
MSKAGVLLINLGTPDAPTYRAVHRYLTEFLTDPRVIDLPWLKRQLLVRGIIIPLRLKNSTQSYQKVWTEHGSPLAHYTTLSAGKLQEKLGGDCIVETAMRYPGRSIKDALDRLLQSGIDRLTIIPLFPQYASATSGSVIEHVMYCLKNYNTLPDIHLISQFYDNPLLLQSFAEQGKPLLQKNYDRVLFSFHGLPMRQLKKADQAGCCGTPNCCRGCFPQNKNCYGAQCYATADGIAKALALDPSRYEVCFQSRLGKEPWMTPFTQERILKLAQEGKKRLIVFCPSFVADCLETLYEISVEYQELFRHAGGEILELVPSLNDSPQWIDTLANLVGKCEPCYTSVHE